MPLILLTNKNNNLYINLREVCTIEIFSNGDAAIEFSSGKNTFLTGEYAKALHEALKALADDD